MSDLSAAIDFVAMLDVLGFSSLVAGDDSATRLDEYLNALQQAFSVGDPIPAVDYVVFSDTIVLTTPDASHISFQAIIRKCSAALGILLQHDIALRGAIACGHYVRSVSGKSVFVAGRSIVEAYRKETDQDWVGIMLAPSVRLRIPELTTKCEVSPNDVSPETLASLIERRRWTLFVQAYQAIPFHSPSALEDSRYEGFAIVPTLGSLDLNGYVQTLDASGNKLGWLKGLAPDPAAQMKYTRAQTFLSDVRQRWEYPIRVMRERNTLPAA